MKSFYEWLLEQTDRDDPVGDFAGDATRDPTFPKGWTNFEKVYTYIYHAVNGDTDLVDALKAAWGEYAPNDDISEYGLEEEEEA